MGKRIKESDKGKSWAKKSLKSAKSIKIDSFKKILVITQDKESSRNYLETWRSRLHGANTIIKVGKAVKKPMQIVEIVDTIRSELESKIAKSKSIERFVFDEVWVAFDKDSFPDFDSAVYALRKKRKCGYREAWSNECFELWYLLHYMDISSKSPIPRKLIFKECSKIFHVEHYEREKGSDILHRDMALRPFKDVITAVKRAKQLDIATTSRCRGSSAQPSTLNPSTKLHNLIEEFIKMASVGLNN